MLLRIFKRTTPGVLLLMFVTLTGLWFSTFLNPSLINTANVTIDPMPLYGLLTLVFGNNYFFGVLFSFSVVILMSFLLIRFNTNIFCIYILYALKFYKFCLWDFYIQYFLLSMRMPSLHVNISK